MKVLEYNTQRKKDSNDLLYFCRNLNWICILSVITTNEKKREEMKHKTLIPIVFREHVIANFQELHDAFVQMKIFKPFE